MPSSPETKPKKLETKRSTETSPLSSPQSKRDLFESLTNDTQPQERESFSGTPNNKTLQHNTLEGTTNQEVITETKPTTKSGEVSSTTPLSEQPNSRNVITDTNVSPPPIDEYLTQLRIIRSSSPLSPDELLFPNQTVGLISPLRTPMFSPMEIPSNASWENETSRVIPNSYTLRKVNQDGLQIAVIYDLLGDRVGAYPMHLPNGGQLGDVRCDDNGVNHVIYELNLDGTLYLRIADRTGKRFGDCDYPLYHPEGGQFRSVGFDADGNINNIVYDENYSEGRGLVVPMARVINPQGETAGLFPMQYAGGQLRSVTIDANERATGTYFNSQTRELNVARMTTVGPNLVITGDITNVDTGASYSYRRTVSSIGNITFDV